MGAYVGHTISVLVTLGGVAIGLVKMWNMLDRRLQKIETRLEMDDKGAPDRAKLREAEMGDIVRGHCKTDCLRASTRATTVPGGVPVYPGGEG